MSHPDEGVLQEYLDGELTDAQSSELRAHLDTCEGCRARLEAQQKLMTEAKELVERLVLEPPPAMPRVRRAPRWTSRTYGIAASLALATATGVMLWKARASTPTGDAVAARPEVAAQVEGALHRADTFRFRSGAESGLASIARESRKASTQAPPSAPAPALAPMADASGRQQEPGVGTRADSLRTPEGAFAVRQYEEVRSADQAASEAPTNSAEPGEGTPLRRIEGLVARSTVMSEGAIRTIYMLGTTPVELVQQQAHAPRAEVTTKQRAAVPPAARTAGTAAEYRWILDGEAMVLRGALPLDSLAALAKLVR